MAAEEVMKLFDLYWFEHGILTPASTIEGRAIIADKGYLKDFLEAEAEAEAEAEPTSLHLALSTTKPFPRMQNEFEDVITKFDGQSLSETSSNASDSSPRSVISTRKLRKIHSGKEISRKGSVKKSLPELESEELKGFKDLGFVFTEEDRKIPGLVSFFPGLQRSSWYGDECGISRPYLSEAWEILDQRKANRELMKWEFPDLENENDMKYHLKMWAQTVASTIR